MPSLAVHLNGFFYLLLDLSLILGYNNIINQSEKVNYSKKEVITMNPEEQEALEYLYDEILCNETDDEIEVWDGFDD